MKARKGGDAGAGEGASDLEAGGVRQAERGARLVRVEREVNAPPPAYQPPAWQGATRSNVTWQGMDEGRREEGWMWVRPAGTADGVVR